MTESTEQDNSNTNIHILYILKNKIIIKLKNLYLNFYYKININ